MIVGEAMAMSANMDMYLRQWLATAGNFQLELAWETNRAQLRCKCGAIFRFDQPQPNATLEKPWVLQDWVVKHGLNGPHDKDPATQVKPVPLTADFKRLPK